MHEGLLDVLMAYAEYRKDIGHVFGLHVSISFLYAANQFRC